MLNYSQLYRYKTLKLDVFYQEITVLYENKNFAALEQLKKFLKERYDSANDNFKIYRHEVNEILYELYYTLDGPTIGHNGLDEVGNILLYNTTIHKELKAKLRKPKNNMKRYENLKWQLELKHNFIVTLNEPIF